MTQDTKEIDPKYVGLDEWCWPVVDKFGRPMFVLVFNANVAGQAAEHLAAIARRFAGGSASGKQNAGEIMHAVTVISTTFNVLSNELVAMGGWTPEQLGECESAIQAAWAAKLVVEEGPKIVLH